jgi:hypothetical protein
MISLQLKPLRLLNRGRGLRNASHGTCFRLTMSKGKEHRTSEGILEMGIRALLTKRMGSRSQGGGAAVRTQLGSTLRSAAVATKRRSSLGPPGRKQRDRQANHRSYGSYSSDHPERTAKIMSLAQSQSAVESWRSACAWWFAQAPSILLR